MSKSTKTRKTITELRRGDQVMVIAGGNKSKRPNKGQVGQVLQIMSSDRILVEGVNRVTKHQRQTGPDKPGGKVSMEAPLHISNVMYYSEKLKRPVRLKSRRDENGKSVRGFVNPETKEFEQI